MQRKETFYEKYIERSIDFCGACALWSSQPFLWLRRLLLFESNWPTRCCTKKCALGFS